MMIDPTGSATYAELRASFSWEVPEALNIGALCADRHPRSAPAMVDVAPDGTRREISFGELSELSNRLANAYSGLGVGPGDRVAIALPQSLETGLAHLAAYKLGAIAVPLSTLFGPDAFRHRIADSGARLVVTGPALEEGLTEIARDLGDSRLLVVDRAAGGNLDFWPTLEDGASDFEVAATGPDTPAILIYTSGTTGLAKGALHGHRVLLGHLPGFQLAHQLAPREGDRLWTPADWAWIGSLINLLLPSWYFGLPVVAAAHAKFDPDWAAGLIRAERVRNTFLPPTALKMVRAAETDLSGTELRSIMCGGEVLGADLLGWVRENTGVTISEIFGQTEANLVVGNCPCVWPVNPGSIGLPLPGHVVEVLGHEFRPQAVGVEGQLAIGVPDPVAFLGYWNKPQETLAKYDPSGEWILTGDVGTRDEEGYLWFAGRDDDMISSAGYRIGPAEIEACLGRHEAVAIAAAIGVPDELRGERVKAYVTLRDGFEPGPDLEQGMQRFVRERLAAYLYPRELEVVDALPMTVTGKVRREELRRIHASGRGMKNEPGQPA
jgi:acetyl-CoA synthetase